MKKFVTLSHRVVSNNLELHFERFKLTKDQEIVVRKAKDGDAAALTQLVRAVQDNVFRLSLRMLADPDGAQDATQEILIRVITKLSTFNGESRFETWVHRVAVNYLLTAQKVMARDPGLTFDIFGADLIDGLVDEDMASPEDHAMLNDLRLNCTMAMLLCLDHKHRAAYVLGEVLEFEHAEAAAILSVEPATFRKQLSRARTSVQAFASTHCGLVDATAPCSCPRRLPAALTCGRLGPGPNSVFADAPGYAAAKAMAGAVNAGLAAVELQRAMGPLRAPEDFAAKVLSLVDPPD
ncbi:RNA polymerase sigma factor [Gimibacter soli]|uniref:RNA polymerase sigma factor n=1 Tax=Gimibacter soli TaxID=3024400 RepID=A0AAF0BMI8_9PROT|nr:RNA polymerase sigma factor [Gimibacter soli]WCL55592.1 RNA polymerase sigma factor [Gimibacter soli]